MEPKLRRPPDPKYIALTGVIVILIGVIFYHQVESLSWLDSLYFCVITLTTIGYGDIVPRTDAGKIFTTFYVVIGIGIFAAVINYLIKRAAMQRIAKRQDSLEDRKQKNRAD